MTPDINEIITNLKILKIKFDKQISEGSDNNLSEELRIRFLGRKGELSSFFALIGKVTEHDRPKLGQELNNLKLYFQNQIDNYKSAADVKPKGIEFFDASLPGILKMVGTKHPLYQVLDEIKDIFISFGFTIETGPELETDYYNFEALNIPKDHPSRDLQDTFYISDDLVMRTHTSPVQIRTMEKYGAPLRIIVPGRVFRYEATDVSHETTFDQVEGLLIDKNISLAHLKGIMIEFLTRFFGKPVKVRFRPGYFPFVEPGIELDLSCILCESRGCRVCKHTGWMEFMGAGMVHPNVLRAGKIDPKIYQGWAFGFGLTRLTMMKYGIDDIRLFLNGNLKFLNQF